ncbi:MAG TPA: cytochrome C oxidase subunit IV family protein [Mycobacterium sp.]|nr:cytochrome C oxidase subunit IV family protein [Mycobacterium sp.]
MANAVLAWKTNATARLTSVWIILSVITVVSWSFAPARDGTTVPSVPITIAVLGMALIKARLIIQYFMEVHTAPRWLRVFTDTWLVVLWAAILGIYLY